MIVDTIRILNSHDNSYTPALFIDLKIDSTAGENGYILKSHDGFDPSPTFEYTAGFMGSGGYPLEVGVPVIDNEPENKELVLRIGLMPGPAGTYSELRTRLYKLISRPVRVLLIAGGGHIADITGRISNVDVQLASNQPDMAITIKCDDGLFSRPMPQYTGIPADPVAKHSWVYDYTDGDAPTGLTFGFESPGGGLGGITLVGTLGELNWYFSFLYPLEIGDYIIVQTEKRERGLFVVRSGNTTEISAYVQSGSIWPMLHPGMNVISKSGSVDSMLVWGFATYLPKFWGI